MALPKIGLEAVLEMGGFSRAVAKYQKFIKDLGNATEGFGISAETTSHAIDTLLPIVGDGQYRLGGGDVEARRKLWGHFVFAKIFLQIGGVNC